MKKVLPFIFIIIVVAEVFFGLFSADKARAAGISVFDYYTSGFEAGNTSAGAAGNPSNTGGSWLVGLAADATYYLIWTPASWFMGLGGWVMNKGINISITGSTFNTLATGKDSAVTVGWGVSRDIVNIFLIFILLYIAIATILQLSGFNTKQLLTTLIVIAFLVNFSSVITKLIIDASNVLTVGFYNTFTTKDSSGETSISKTFENALDIDKLAGADINKIADSLTRLLALLFTSILMLIAGFIFLVFGVLFIIRMVTLLILIILSPLAFAAHVLPSTKTHAKKWWDQLFNQAFFAPAALFMLYLAAGIAQSNVIRTALNIPATGGPNVGNMVAAGMTENKASDLFAFTLQFVIIAIFLIASIIVAKQMGAIGADAVQKGLTKAGKKFQGYAGRISKKYGTMAVGRASEGILKGEGRVAQTLKSLPLVSRGLARVSGLEKERSKKQVEKYKKGYGNYSDAGLKELVDEKTGKVKDPTIFGAKRKALEEVAAERKTKEKKKEEKGAHKKELDAAIKSGNIMEIMAVSARMQAAAAEATGEAAEKLSAAAEKETKAKTKGTEPPTPKT